MEQLFKVIINKFDLLKDNKQEDSSNKKISDVLNNMDKSAEFIRELLEQIEIVDDKTKKNFIRSKLSNRINHTLFTFALGIVLCDFLDLKNCIEEKYKKYFEDNDSIFLKVWILTSLYHDYGYFIQNQEEYKNVETLNISDIKDIFTYYESNVDKELPRYSIDLIKNYFEYYAKNNKDNSKEILEHGILGGYVLFDKFLSENKKSSLKINCKNNYFYQNICFRIMEHNIWRIDSKNKFFENFDRDTFNEIYENNFPKITLEEPLLLLLSLCDTIEFVKKLPEKGTKKNYIKNISEIIYIEVNKDFIKIDISKTENIFNEIENSKNENNKDESSGNKKSIYQSWKDSIMELNKWLNVDAKEENNIITLNYLMN